MESIGDLHGYDFDYFWIWGDYSINRWLRIIWMNWEVGSKVKWHTWLTGKGQINWSWWSQLRWLQWHQW